MDYLYEARVLNKKGNYDVSYVLSTPPKYAKNKRLWKTAVFRYLKKNGFREPEIVTELVPDKFKWPEVIRIYNTLIGKKNRKRSKESKARKRAPEVGIKVDKKGGNLVKSELDYKVWKAAKAKFKREMGTRTSKVFTGRDWNKVVKTYKVMKKKKR